MQAPYVFKISTLLRTKSTKSEAEVIKIYDLSLRKVAKGLKEASWNFKYMKILEGSALKIENKYSKIVDSELVIASTLRTIKNIFENSNFYKEARVTSLMERVVNSIISKFRVYFELGRIFIKNEEELQEILE